MTLLTLLSGASGTAAPVVFSGLYQTTVRRRIDALDVTKREGVTDNAPTEVKRKIEVLKVNRSG